MIDGKSQAWRDAADQLIDALARDNKYIVGDMLVIFLESAGYGLDSYEPLGGVFKRAAKRGIISKIERPTKQALWYSKIYQDNLDHHEHQICAYVTGDNRITRRETVKALIDHLRGVAGESGLSNA